MIAINEQDGGSLREGDEGYMTPKTFSLMEFLDAREKLARDFASAASSDASPIDDEDDLEKTRKSASKWRLFGFGRRSP